MICGSCRDAVHLCKDGPDTSKPGRWCDCQHRTGTWIRARDRRLELAADGFADAMSISVLNRIPFPVAIDHAVTLFVQREREQGRDPFADCADLIGEVPA